VVVLERCGVVVLFHGILTSSSYISFHQGSFTCMQERPSRLLTCATVHLTEHLNTIP
jgi:hypothetical protein